MKKKSGHTYRFWHLAIFSGLFFELHPSAFQFFAASGKCFWTFLAFRRPAAFFRPKKSKNTCLRQQKVEMLQDCSSKNKPEKIAAWPKTIFPSLFFFHPRFFNNIYQLEAQNHENFASVPVSSWNSQYFSFYLTIKDR